MNNSLVLVSLGIRSLVEGDLILAALNDFLEGEGLLEVLQVENDESTPAVVFSEGDIGTILSFIDRIWRTSLESFMKSILGIVVQKFGTSVFFLFCFFFFFFEE